MREILFRGKRVGDGEWVVGTLVKMGPVGYVCHFILPDYASAFYDIEVDPATVGQYTGLTDKNGVKVFEGDILSIENPHPFKPAIEIVEFSKVRWTAGVMDLDEILNGWLCTIIGNIHDNPELLSKEESQC